MKNIVATLIILHNIESLFHACELLPRKDGWTELTPSLRAHEAIQEVGSGKFLYYGNDN